MTAATSVLVRLPAGVTLAVEHELSLVHVEPADADARHARGLPAHRAAEYLAARALLRRLLLSELGASAATTVISARRSGQPYLPERPDLGISLSHAGGHVAAAVGKGLGVGIDVQVPLPVSPALLRRCCSPGVAAELAALPQAARDEEFAWIWTAQEACVKASSTGLAGRPWTIRVDRGQRQGEWRGYRWLSLREDSAVPVSVAYGRSEGGSG